MSEARQSRKHQVYTLPVSIVGILVEFACVGVDSEGGGRQIAVQLIPGADVIAWKHKPIAILNKEPMCTYST